MQIIVDIQLSPVDYATSNLDELLSPLSLCPCCRKGKPHKHGTYTRFCIDGFKLVAIRVRRYYCPACRITVSLLPSFCVPRFQYHLNVLWQCIRWRFSEERSLDDIVQGLQQHYPIILWTPQQVHFYSQRFLDNLSWIAVVLRKESPQLDLADSIKKRAKKVLTAIEQGFPNPQSFAQLFFDECQCAFLAQPRV